MGHPNEPVRLPLDSARVSSLMFAAVNAGAHAVAVVLDLVQPAIARRRLIDQPRELRLDPFGRSS